MNNKFANTIAKAVFKAIAINNKLTGNKRLASRMLTLFWTGCGWLPLVGGFALTALLVLATSPVTIYTGLLSPSGAQVFATGFLVLTTSLMVIGKLKGPKTPTFLLGR